MTEIGLTLSLNMVEIDSGPTPIVAHRISPIAASLLDAFIWSPSLGVI